MGVVKRIGQLDGGPAWILGLQPEMVEIRIAHEWQRDHLDEPGTGHGSVHPATRLLGLGETTTASGTWQHRLNCVEPALASHFLDVVERIDEIRGDLAEVEEIVPLRDANDSLLETATRPSDQFTSVADGDDLATAVAALTGADEAALRAAYDAARIGSGAAEVVFVDELPHTATGKILKRELG